MHEIRFNPLIKQWIIVAKHRAVRPWRPEERQISFQCPFCPGAPELKHLEKWGVAVLPNRYPALTLNPPQVELEEFTWYTKERHGV
jgi:UDPglucose--hexose-1-phosphate uridylyltransferase